MLELIVLIGVIISFSLWTANRIWFVFRKL